MRGSGSQFLNVDSDPRKPIFFETYGNKLKALKNHRRSQVRVPVIMLFDNCIVETGEVCPSK